MGGREFGRRHCEPVEGLGRDCQICTPKRVDSKESGNRRAEMAGCWEGVRRHEFGGQNGEAGEEVRRASQNCTPISGSF